MSCARPVAPHPTRGLPARGRTPCSSGARPVRGLRPGRLQPRGRASCHPAASRGKSCECHAASWVRPAVTRALILPPRERASCRPAVATARVLRASCRCTRTYPTTSSSTAAGARILPACRRGGAPAAGLPMCVCVLPPHARTSSCRARERSARVLPPRACAACPRHGVLKRFENLKDGLKRFTNIEVFDFMAWTLFDAPCKCQYP